MRVNVTYSVDLEEVPQITRELLSKATKNLEILFKKYQKISCELEAENEKKALRLIDDCRKLMAMADQDLSDCYSMLGGYQQTLFQLQNQKKESPDEILKDG
jgi:hypothetical protein